jgi:protein-disulfide isomerase
MKNLSTALLVSSTLLLAGCGVDTSGLSPESSRTPKGSETALVMITEYGDFQCPACKGAHEILTKPIMAKYEGKVRFSFQHFPLMAIHPYALEAAEAAECAADQGKFWEYFDLVYEHQADLSSSALRDWAAELKLDAPLFDRCVKSEIKKKTILADQATGMKVGVN